MLDVLRTELHGIAGSLIDGSTSELPGEFRRALRTFTLADYGLELSLLACASSLWCGADESAGIPAAVSALLMRAAVMAHLCTMEGSEDLFGISVVKWNDPTTAILAGDGLIALSIQYLAGKCGRYSARLISEMVKAVGASGMLSGLSLTLDRSEGLDSQVPDGRAIYELYSGQLARFASYGGALLAGASDMMLDDAAQIGVLTGRARFLSGRAELMKDIEERKSLVFQARTLIEQAEAIIGRGRDSTLFNSILYLSDFI